MNSTDILTLDLPIEPVCPPIGTGDYLTAAALRGSEGRPRRGNELVMRARVQRIGVVGYPVGGSLALWAATVLLVDEDDILRRRADRLTSWSHLLRRSFPAADFG